MGRGGGSGIDVDAVCFRLCFFFCLWICFCLRLGACCCRAARSRCAWSWAVSMLKTLPRFGTEIEVEERLRDAHGELRCC